MSISNVQQAIQAYAAAPKPDAGAEAGAGSAFSEMLAASLDETIKATQAGEAAIRAGAAGKAELVDVVTAVANAEATLETMVALRDRMINAYQEIMRMPI